MLSRLAINQDHNWASKAFACMTADRGEDLAARLDDPFGKAHVRDDTCHDFGVHAGVCPQLFRVSVPEMPHIQQHGW